MLELLLTPISKIIMGFDPNDFSKINQLTIVVSLAIFIGSFLVLAIMSLIGFIRICWGAGPAEWERTLVVRSTVPLGFSMHIFF